MKIIEKEWKLWKELAKFLLLSSMLGGMAIAPPSICEYKSCGLWVQKWSARPCSKPTYEGFESNQLSLKLKTGRVDVVGAREGKKESAHDAGAYQFALIYKSEGGEEETVAKGQNTADGTIEFDDVDLWLNSGTVKLYIRQTTKDDGRFKQLDNGEGEVTVSLAYDGSGRLMVDSLASSNPIYRNFITGYNGSETGGSDFTKYNKPIFKLK